jgi:hypothetical protein
LLDCNQIDVVRIGEVLDWLVVAYNSWGMNHPEGIGRQRGVSFFLPLSFGMVYLILFNLLYNQNNTIFIKSFKQV